MTATAVDAPHWPDPLPVPAEVAELCATIRSDKLADVFSLRALARHHRHLSSDQVRSGVELLEKSNLVRRLAPLRVVGRPVERYRRNPKLTLNY